MLLIGADAATDLDLFDAAQTAIVQENFTDYQSLKARGFDVATRAEGDFDGAACHSGITGAGRIFKER